MSESLRIHFFAVHSAVVLCVLGFVVSLALAAGGELARFELVERFNVSHPDQIVTFDLPVPVDQERATLTVGDGGIVPFQVLSDGRLALRTDLPAGATRQWLLQDGAATEELAPGVLLTTTDTYYEITNEWIGIRVPKPVSDLAAGTPAPIQGLRYQDGTWTALGPNLMNRPALSMAVKVIDAGPLVVRLEVSYTFPRAELRGAKMPEVIPAGVGAYRSTIEVQAGQPSILFEDYSEVDVSYAVSIYEGLEPTRGQYRGHHSTSIEAGRNSVNGQYGTKETGAGTNFVGVLGREDALVDLDYESGRRDRWSATRYPWVSHWDAWAVNTGNYWQVYAPDGPTDNLFGIFDGRPSRLIGPGWSGVSIDTRMVAGGEGEAAEPPTRRDAGIRLQFQRLRPDQHYYRVMRFGWGIFLGRRSEDLKPLTETQGIGRQLNLHSGVNLTKLKDVSGDNPDPVAGHGGMYMSPEASQRVADELQKQFKEGRRDLYQVLAVDGNLQPLVQYWQDPTRERAQALCAEITGFAADYVDTLVNGPGIWDTNTIYFMGALRFAPRLLVADQLLATDFITGVERTRLKQALVLFGMQLWDDDQAPMQPEGGVNLGPANMSSMWLGTRYAYAAYLAQHPQFKPRVSEVKDRAVEMLGWYVNDDGACSASAHYAGASMTPILNLLQQLQVSGIADFFAELPKIKRYAEWEMQLMTPPEVRFGGKRKIIAVGDGSTESSTRVGQLATGVAPGDPDLGARLMGAWQEMGSQHSSFFGTSTLKIDEALPGVSPDLGDDQFKGWMSVLRHGWGTPDESSIHLVNGDFLSDHRHNDMGTVILYALGAPLSVDWGPIYYPRVAGSMMHSTVTPDYLLSSPWDADATPLDKPTGGGGLSDWWHTQHTPLVSTPDFGTATASWGLLAPAKDKQVSWQRTVRDIHPDPAHPVFVIDDRFGGRDAAALPMISTLNMMATGAVQTPSGPVTPEERTYDWRDKENQQLPSAGAVIKLAAGVSRLQFTGQWLIDWDLYIDVDEPVEITLGNWGHTWHPNLEANEFRKANNRPFEERQHILRLRGKDHFRVVIIPYRKGQRPENLTVQRDGVDLTVHNGPVLIKVTDRGYENL